MPEIVRFYGIIIKLFLVTTRRLIFTPSTVNITDYLTLRTWK